MIRADETVLSIQNLEVVYSDVILALRGVSLDVPVRAIVALLGANGAGKTTGLRAISGLLPAHTGSDHQGFDHASAARTSPIVRRRASSATVWPRSWRGAGSSPT